ncbi:MAG: sensor histidine kinase KdpD [Myxococcales bacterium]|nr:sensor histidine kinase KdpD [Myxococcales bacterium]
MNVESEHRRPDPDALLRRVMADDRKRTRLKIFFGFAPGVGKTYAMLESARRLQTQGVDVVVGIIETHGRSETASLVEGLEVMPRKRLDYRGRQMEEFDLERALSRKPAVLLLDELAHSNVEGSRHTRRWQDVLELLDAGIEVHTTLNVQHVESLNDVVAQITHVQVRETVPDALLDRADSIELVDLPPEDLLKRLADGKVYLPEQARRASEHFFRPGNLLALRELALRRTAERVDDEVQAYRQLHEIQTTWPAGERLLVCVGPAPASARLVRAARRMAAGLRAPWYAVWVSNPVAPMGREDQQRLESHLELVESLGGEVVRLSGTVVAEELLTWARSHNITRIVLGKPTHTWWRDRLRGSLLDSVVRGSGDIDVLAISGDEDAPSKPSERARAETRPWWEWLAAAGIVAVLCGITFPLHRGLQIPDPEMLFFLGIMITAAAFGRGPALLASGLSVAAYNFFFVPPYFTFAVTDTRYVLTFAMMFGVGVLISTLGSRLRQQELAARQREADTRALFNLTRDLAQAPTVEALAAALSRHIVDASGGAVVVLLPRDGTLAALGAWPGSPSLESNDLGVIQWAHEHGREAGLGTETLAGARLVAVPVGQGAGVVAWLPGGGVYEHARRALLDAFVRQAGLAIDRFQFSEAAKTAALKAPTEELRSSLLSTVSHDLRTPLAVVTGAAQTLRDDASIDLSTRTQLLDTICDEADRLERMVRNLLDMTRVQSGALSVKKEWVPVDELIGSARGRLTKALEGREVTVRSAAEVPFLQVDPLLFEQVLFNLLDNAAKYTPRGSPLELEVSKGELGARIAVMDRGPGVRPENAERLFDKFVRGSQQGVAGAGLGLAICRGIVEAHGGRIHADERPGGGASFIVDLPIVGVAPEVPQE